MFIVQCERTWKGRATRRSVGKQNDVAGLHIDPKNCRHAIVRQIDSETIWCKEKLDRMLQSIRCVGKNTLAQSRLGIEDDDLRCATVADIEQSICANCNAANFSDSLRRNLRAGHDRSNGDPKSHDFRRNWNGLTWMRSTNSFVCGHCVCVLIRRINSSIGSDCKGV